jgi:cytochrome c
MRVVLNALGRSGRAACLLATLTTPIAAPVHAEDVDPAKQQFLTSCGVCHSVDPGAGARQGPNLFGVYGRKVGSVVDFKYSSALKSGDWTWNEATLDPWITNSQEAHPGTFMSYRQSNPEKRKLVIEYLKSLSAPK